MAFDQTTRNRLARFVGEARSLLTEEFTGQLQNEYGMDPTSGEITAIEKLTALDDARRETARILRETVDYYHAGKPADARIRQETIERVLREQAFTVLNRLCALRLAEARGLILDVVAQGYHSKGFQLYARLAGNALGEMGEAYRSYLFSLFDELAVELPPLFDRFSPQGRLFPLESALLNLLELLNDPELEGLWTEDETIGWIYQYFNSKEERQTMRAASQAPRNSRELAVRNQFFTPRYVVEFLTDNTLGHIWYEMTKGDTSLKDTCRYLVRRPNEIFLAEGEEAPAQAESESDLSQEELLKQPVYIPHRPLKDPREIKMLDPACGSMHFGLYASDLFEQIYLEAWDLEERLGLQAPWRLADLDPLHQTYPNREAFLRDVPRLIIERNIHGIDIDPRAVQIAGLSLWLRAQKSWQAEGLKPHDRPQIRKSNIVCAEPMPGDRMMLEEFLLTLREDRLESLLCQVLHVPVGQKVRATKAMSDALAKLVRTVWKEMELAGEAGSLLKIEETLRDAIATARQESEEKAPLFRVLEFSLHEAPNKQSPHGENSQARNFWDWAEKLVLAALESYTGQAMNGDSFRRQLFAGDAAQGFSFIDLCQKHYDVVLMNPPFGDFAYKTMMFAEIQYPSTKNDIYGAFVERTATITTQNGRIGAIMPRTWLALTRFEGLRNIFLDKLYLEYLIDLGYTVLESMAEVAVVVISRIKVYKETAFLGAFSSENKLLKIRQFVDEVSSSVVVDVLVKDIHHFRDIPQKIFAFGLPITALDAVSQHKTVEGSGVFAVKQGIATGDNERFLRLLTEIPVGSLKRDWIAYAKGGDFGMFYTSLELAVKWYKEGYEIKTRAALEYGSASRTVKNEDSFFSSGLTFSLVSQAGFSVRVLPSGCIYDMGGPCIFLANEDTVWTLESLLAVLNSSFTQYCLNFLTDSRHWHVITVQSLPIGDLFQSDENLLASLALDCVRRLVEWSTKDETDSKFIYPLPSVKIDDLKPIIISLHDSINELYSRVVSNIEQIDKIVSSRFFYSPTLIDELRKKRLAQMFYHWPTDVNETAKIFSDRVLSWVIGCVFGRWDIRFVTNDKPIPELPEPFAPLPACPPGMLQNAKGLPIATIDVPADYPLRITWGGILTDDEGHPEDVEGRARDTLHVIWQDRADGIEAEACQILGVRSLREYFQKPVLFFADHLKRYSKSRRQAPIYWPLSTPSNSYTLWLYYHRLSDQSLFTCVNDFVDPKLKQVSETSARLRAKKGRTTADESELERLVDFERELKDFRTELLRVAAFWKPNLNDGVEITAAPLWPLFQYKPWQKRLKETWGKLEAGEYDWAHLAYSIWPERVREKCKSDKSLAIAHELEELYVEPKTGSKKKGGRKKKEEPEMEGLFDEEL